MSVINKMLRDLDARRSDGAVPDHPRQASPAAMQGTVSVQTTARPSSHLLRWLLSALLLLAAGAAAYWYLDVSPPLPVLPPVAAGPAAAASAPAPEPAASAPELTASAPAEPIAPVTEARAVVEPEPSIARNKKRRNDAGAMETSPRVAAVEKPARRRPSSGAADAAVATPVPGPAAASTAPIPSEPASTPAANAVPQRRLGLVQETLAQAQGLWNAGSREPALELVRETVAAVERSQPVDVPLLAQLVREQVRMELALGRPAAVLSLLTRLEPALSGQADMWAVRGNAAQRLGRHQESVQAYLAALQLRPGEPRWMLGAAVSLAALGQLEAAARQAEQARALGPVSPEVLTYLRQAGVPLR